MWLWGFLDFEIHEKMVKFFVATGLAVASATDCGTCWEADESGQCVPQAGKVTTTCGSNSIQVTIDACLLEGTHNYADRDLNHG